MLTQQAATTRITSRTMPLNGASQLLQVLEGSGWFHSWHCSEIGRFGEGLQSQFKTLFQEHGWAFSAGWMQNQCHSCKVTPGDLVWVPFGYFTAVTSSTAGPLVTLAMPYVNAKLVRRNGDSSLALLDESCPWNDSTTECYFHS